MRLAASLALLGLSGCWYSAGTIAQERRGGYKGYPTTVEEEEARRTSRRHRALLAAPLEVVGGLGLAALALYSPIAQEDDGDNSVLDNLGDGAKEIAGRLLLASAGLGIAGGGLGDAVLGATDPLMPSPLVRHGALVPADQIDLVAPSPSPRLNLHASQGLSLTGVTTDLGLGVFRWLGPRWRLRAAASFEVGIRLRGANGRAEAATADLGLARAYGRHHLGLFPRRAVGVFAGGGYAWGEPEARPEVRGGLTLGLGFTEVRLGGSWSPGEPGVQLVLRRELPVD